MHESFVDWSDARRALLSAPLQALWAEGAQLSAAQLARARAQLRARAGQLAQTFCGIDLLLTPATPTTAPLLPATPATTPQNWFTDHAMAYAFNLTQQPALSLPLGQDAQGLPFNLQIVGRRYADDLVLDFGRVVEALLARPAA